MSRNETELLEADLLGAERPRTTRLGTGLKVRHLTMMGLGSAIGAGLFLGTGTGIRAAGPAILLSYAVAGVLVVLVMRMLAEMAAALPSSGSFSTYAEEGIGRWAGFTLGWVYWAPRECSTVHGGGESRHAGRRWDCTYSAIAATGAPPTVPA